MSTDTPTPVELFLRTVSLAVGATYSSLSVAAAVFRAILKPLLSATVAVGRILLAPFLFLLAPVFFALNVALDVIIRKPFSLMARTAEDMQGVWVFFGVALLISAVLGLGAREAARALAGALVAPASSARRVDVEEEEKRTAARDVKGKRRAMDGGDENMARTRTPTSPAVPARKGKKREWKTL